MVADGAYVTLKSDRPAALSACSASAICCPVTFGMVMITGPSEGMSVTLPPCGRREPGRGLIEITSPFGTVSLCLALPITTDRSADVSSPRAVLTDILATLGTLTYRPE